MRASVAHSALNSHQLLLLLESSGHVSAMISYLEQLKRQQLLFILNE